MERDDLLALAAFCLDRLAEAEEAAAGAAAAGWPPVVLADPVVESFVAGWPPERVLSLVAGWRPVVAEMAQVVAWNPVSPGSAALTHAVRGFAQMWADHGAFVEAWALPPALAGDLGGRERRGG